jgi:hypothetical protein
MDTKTGLTVLQRKCSTLGEVDEEMSSYPLMTYLSGFSFQVHIVPGSLWQMIKMIFFIEEPMYTVGEVKVGEELIPTVMIRKRKINKVIDYHYAVLPECSCYFRLYTDPEDFNLKYQYNFKFEKVKN